MNFPSCIKMPVSRNDNSPEQEKISFNSFSDKSSSITYDELISIADGVFGIGKWSHAVTSQTVDFVEYVMGKYQIGCAAFVRVELPDKTFHEEMGYSNAESSAKGLAVYSARASSITNALKKALLCFGGVIEKKMTECTFKSNKRKLIKLENDEVSSEAVEVGEIVKQTRINSTSARSKSPNTTEAEQIELKSYNKTATNECITKNEVSESKTISSSKLASFNQQSVDVNVKSIENASTSRQMSDEELRNERKRKQREKQEEYRRLMMKDKESKVEDKFNFKF